MQNTYIVGYCRCPDLHNNEIQYEEMFDLT